MAKVTTKLQVTVPKTIADRYGIRPGDDIEWVAAGETIRVIPASDGAEGGLTPAERLRLFDKATARQDKRNKAARLGRARRRGWTREDLYERGRAR